MNINSQALIDLERHTGVSWRQFLADLINAPCADALEKLWQNTILKRNPDYGEWEYPGQAYRHLVAEFKELEAENERLRAIASYVLNPIRPENVFVSGTKKYYHVPDDAISSSS